MLHPPVVHKTGTADIWMSSSHDLRTWGNSRDVMGARRGGRWDSVRIGAGPPPVETDAGWLLIYHAGAGNDRRFFVPGWYCAARHRAPSAGAGSVGTVGARPGNRSGTSW